MCRDYCRKKVVESSLWLESSAHSADATAKLFVSFAPFCGYFFSA